MGISVSFTGGAQDRERANYRALWVATAVGYLGVQVARFVLPLFATGLTDSPVLVSGVALALAAPWLVIGLPAGAIVDRCDRRLVLVGVNGLRLGAIGLLAGAAVVDAVTLPLVYLSALLLGVAETFAETVTGVIVPMVVREERLDGANARLFGARTAVEIAALPVGGALAAVGLGLASGAGGVCFAVAVGAGCLLIGRFRPEHVGEGEGRRLWAEVGKGLRFLWGHRLLRTIGLMAAAINACWSAWGTLLVLYAVEPGPMRLSEFEYGLLLTMGGFGGLLGSVMAGKVQGRFGRRWAIGINIGVNGVMFAVTAVTIEVWLVAPALLIGDFGGPLWGIAVLSLQARVVPDGLRGRVGSAYRFVSFGAMAVGSAVGGVAAEVVGTRAVFAACAVVTLAMLVPFARVVTERAMAGKSE